MNATKPWTIYILRDPRTSAIRYVGVTTQGLAKRLSSHIKNLHGTPRCAWIRELIACGLQPSLEAVETGSGDWQATERSWIQRCKNDGCPLTNTTIGGNGTAGYQFTPEVRAKIGAASKGKKHSPERIAKVAAAHRALNRKVTEEHKAKVGERHRGKSFISEEGRKRISEWSRNRVVSASTRSKLSALRKGKPKSEEWRAKISATVKGFKHSDAARAKMREAWDKRKLERSEFPEKHTIAQKCDCGTCGTCYKREWGRRKRQAQLELWRASRRQE
jgi:hypothetical protein